MSALQLHHQLGTRFLHRLLLLAGSVLSVFLATTALRQQALPSRAQTPATWYVSKTRPTSASVVRELNQIPWANVLPGDTILIEPGTYTSTLTVGKSGTSSSLITIRATGPVNIFGGRSTLLPECGQANYSYQTSGVRTIGIRFNNQDYVTLDGGTWNGISIYGHNLYGIELTADSNNITVKNVQIYDNGSADQDGGVWNPDQEGVRLAGNHIRFERVHIHDNGQDAFQSGGGINNFTFYESWAYNKRPHSTAQSTDGSGPLPFNHCTHSDAVQVYNGGNQSGFTFEKSVIGPGFLQGVLLGGNVPSQNQLATLHNATFKDVLTFGNHNANLMGYENTQSTNWRLENVTSIRAFSPGGLPCTGAERWHNVFIRGSGHSITNSIFVGGCSMTIPSSTSVSNNCQWNIKGGTSVGTSVNPAFTNSAFNPSANSFGDFTPTASACATKGSSIKSVAQFLSLVSTPVSNPPVPLPTQPTSGLPVISTSHTFEAESGQLTGFTTSGGYIFQASETTNPTSGSRAAFAFNVPVTGIYTVTGLVKAPSLGANSFFINMDTEPTSPLMIWDIQNLSNSFQNVTVSWRGNGTETAPEPFYNPRLFNLPTGNHTLIIRGREANVQLDKITITRTSPLTTPTPIPTSTPIPTLVPTSTPAPTAVPLSSIEFEAEDTSIGTIAYPFVIFSGRISQSDETLNPADGGRAAYSVNIAQTGNYQVRMSIDTPTTANNSFFVNFDSEPTSPNMIWDINPVTSPAGSYSYRTVSWRGNGTETSPQFSSKVFNLSAGKHTLIIRGRERRARIDKIVIFPAP